MKYLKFIITLIFAANLYSCYSQKKDIKKVTKELLESIYENDSISLLKFNSTPYFHCKLQSNLKESFYFIDVVLNQNPSKNFCYDIDIKGVKSLVYIEDCNYKPNETNPFSIPDTKFWKFLVKKTENNFVFYELKIYPNIHNQYPDDTFRF